ncbi:FHA domain-containing protein [Methyloprofundus sp.]|uniref:FHA domain-containing protein n=1 Tax=Methyloprofundus sp. TaxID=2020875 RepID=UPI003D13F714
MMRFIVGRDDSNVDVFIPDESVSRRHLAIEVDSSNQVYLQDLGTMNGSFILRHVGKVKISNKQSVNLSDRILLGGYETTVAGLLNLFTNKNPNASQESDYPNKATQAKKEISRFIIMEDGQHARKT